MRYTLREENKPWRERQEMEDATLEDKPVTDAGGADADADETRPDVPEPAEPKADRRTPRRPFDDE